MSTSDGRLTRRDLLKYGAAAGAALTGVPITDVFAREANRVAGKKLTGTLTMWSPDTRAGAIASNKWWASAFERANPGVKVNLLIVPYGDDTTKLKAGNASGNVPDIIWAYSDFLTSYGVDGLTRPVTNIINKVGKTRFEAGPLNGIDINHTFYAVPFVGFPFFIYYRKDLYKAHGLKPPKTHAQLLANAAALHNPPGMYGYMLTNQSISDTWNLKTAMWTHGAYYFDKQNRLALNRPQTTAAWNFYKALSKYSPPGSMAKSDLESRQLMLDGGVAHMFTTTSFAAGFTSSNISKFGAALYPRVKGAKGASIDFNGLEIPTKAKRPDLATAFIEFLLRPSNFQQYLARTVVGWVPMLGDAYTHQYLSVPQIALVKQFIKIGGQASKDAVVGTGYWGPSTHATALVSTNVEKQIGDRLVVLNQSPANVLNWAVSTIKSAM